MVVILIALPVFLSLIFLLNAFLFISFHDQIKKLNKTYNIKRKELRDILNFDHDSDLYEYTCDNSRFELVPVILLISLIVLIPCMLLSLFRKKNLIQDTINVSDKKLILYAEEIIELERQILKLKFPFLYLFIISFLDIFSKGYIKLFMPVLVLKEKSYDA